MDDSGDGIEKRITEGHCPHCNERGFVLGPMGGRSINIECANLECRSRFNVAMVSGSCLMAHAIPNETQGGGAWPSSPLTKLPKVRRRSS